MDADMQDAVTISTSWRPSMDYSLSALFSQTAHHSQEHSQDVCTQKDPPLSQLNLDEIEPEVRVDITQPPKPWARLICKSPDLPSYDLLHVPEDESGRQNSYLIGRGSACNLRIDSSPRISNKHCVIFCKPNMADRNNVFLEAWIEDLSANGTYLNKDIKLQKGVPRLLRSRDEIHFINPALVNVVTKEDLVRNTFLITIDLPVPKTAGTRTLRSHTLAMELQGAIGRSNTVISLLSQNRRISDHYEFGARLGEGACGTVFLGVDKATGREWAVKVIDMRRLSWGNSASLDNVTREAQMLRSLRHPSIIRLEDIFAEGSQLFLVMELSKGGDLFDRIASKRRYSEDETCLVMRQILLAMKYLHDRNVAHRDLKPENILLVHRDNDIELKITDFGLAKVADDKQALKTFCGTPQYYAPEVLRRKPNDREEGHYTLAADMWSVGVIMFVLLAGQYPFEEQMLESQILSANFSLDAPVWAGISVEAKDLIRSLLVVDPLRRLTATQALESPWLRRLQNDDSTMDCTTSTAGSKRGADGSMPPPANGSREEPEPAVEQVEVAQTRGRKAKKARQS